MKIRKTKAVRRGLRTLMALFEDGFDIRAHKLVAQERHDLTRAMDWVKEQSAETFSDDKESGEEKDSEKKPTTALREQMFMDHFYRVPSNVVARALSALTRGISWTGCGKSHMAECWADPWLGHESMQSIQLEEIGAEINRQKKERETNAAANIRSGDPKRTA